MVVWTDVGLILRQSSEMFFILSRKGLTVSFGFYPYMRDHIPTRHEANQALYNGILIDAGLCLCHICARSFRTMLHYVHLDKL